MLTVAFLLQQSITFPELPILLNSVRKAFAHCKIYQDLPALNDITRDFDPGVRPFFMFCAAFPFERNYQSFMGLCNSNFANWASGLVGLGPWKYHSQISASAIV